MRGKSCIISAVKTRLASPPGFRCMRGVATGVLALLGFATAEVVPIHASAAEPVEVHTTIVFFSDGPMRTDQWPELFDALRIGLGTGGAETALLDHRAQFVNGNDSMRGFDVDTAITVYLHGNCMLPPLQHRTAYSVPLGWVKRIDGEIQPFVHVDCTQIGQEIGEQVRWLSRQSRDHAMAKAMAQVILHEWIHIATQSDGHAKKGIAKAQFDVPDLIGDERATPSPRDGGK
jgi:hypothetical protein